MEDQSLFSNSQPQNISEGLQNFIDAMVEEIVLEGKPFDTQKKSLRKFSENEGLNYEAIENGITELIETLGEMKSSDSKLLMKLALIQAKEACVTEAEVLRIVEQISKKEDDTQRPKKIPIIDYEDSFFQGVQNQASQDEICESNNDFKTKKYEYVDLGLPSGTLWATCNIGANKPEDYGDYIAWGETSTKSAYDWNTYKYANGAYDKLTKYCSKKRNGKFFFTDNLSQLQSVDDPATTNWGSGWQMPSKTQWDELLDNTTNEWTMRNGVNGRLFTSKKNGQTLFLPAAGIRWDKLSDAGSDSHYWSGSLCTDYPDSAWGLFFDSDHCYVYNYSRKVGFSVRPICRQK